MSALTPYMKLELTPALTLVKLELECEGDLETLADKPAEKQWRKKKTAEKLFKKFPEVKGRWERAGGSLTGVHVCSVWQWLCLPPKANGLLLLLLQDEATQVGLDLDPPKTPSVMLLVIPFEHECASYSSCSLTNLFQLLFLQRLGLLCQVFKLIFFFLQLLLPPLNLCNSSALMFMANSARNSRRLRFKQ